MYVPGAPDKIAPSEARAEFGAFLAGASISPSVPSRAPEEYCAQSRIPAAPITAANTVATRETAVKYLRSSIGGLRRREEGGGAIGDVDHNRREGEAAQACYPARVAKVSDE